MSSTLKTELDKYGVFTDTLPDIVTTIANSIPNMSIPQRMKVAIAISEITKYTSQFKRHIDLGDGSLIPINTITFCIGKSGVGKDSSVRAVQKCFNSSYEIINNMRVEAAKAIAIEEAVNAGVDNAEDWSAYKEFYVAPGPIEIGISTAEGLLQHLADLSNGPIGAGYLYSGEVATELQTNTNFIDNVKVLSELYDEGNKSMKALKDKSKQTEVNNIAVSALFMGSADNILYDEPIKRKFKTEFTSKLGRRSFFVYVNEDIKQEEITDVVASIAKNRKHKKDASESKIKASQYIEELTQHLLGSLNIPVTLEEETEVLFELYKMYNANLSEKMTIQYPITKVARFHMQWKALKIAGALALLDGKDSVSREHYTNAIRFTEMLATDTQNFEKELVKEPYEMFCSYCRDVAIDTEVEVSLHSLRKLGYIPLKGNPTAKMSELIQLANSYDKEANYRLGEDSIICNILVKTSTIKISYLDCVGTKEERRLKCSKGFITQELTFADIEEVLQEDLAYSPFVFRDGIRGKDNIISGCKWLVLDIDTSNITDKETHVLLGDLNHYVVRSSNPDNEFKFRVILEIDAEIDVPDTQWGLFIQCVGEELGLVVDRLGKSQIFFSYASSKDSLMRTLDGEPLIVKPILDKVQNMSLNGASSVSTLPVGKKKEFLANPTVTFKYAFEARKGARSRSLIRAAYHAKDLGATQEEVVNLMGTINNYWTYPLDEERFNQTIISQVTRWSY